jgi:hypothetical protein
VISFFGDIGGGPLFGGIFNAGGFPWISGIFSKPFYLFDVDISGGPLAGFLWFF